MDYHCCLSSDRTNYEMNGYLIFRTDRFRLILATNGDSIRRNSTKNVRALSYYSKFENVVCHVVQLSEIGDRKEPYRITTSVRLWETYFSSQIFVILRR